MYENPTQRHIELTISIEARHLDPTHKIGACLVSDNVVLTLPLMDSKQIVFPKVMDGAIGNIMDAHQRKVMDATTLQRDEEKAAEERERGSKMGLKFAD